jgi:16S rRNA (cytidine1402-2'-O)-methyltransferase
MSGTLYVVATPIGNLEDITLRALRVLRDASVIAAEDTRRTARLLSHHSIATRTISFHAHNTRSRVPLLISRLVAGERVALVTDAGTPGVSDPGLELVQAAIDNGIRIDPVPGASAPLVALIGSGFTLVPFTMWGFAPNRPKARKHWLTELSNTSHTFSFFEVPHRIRETLVEAGPIFGIRPIVLARELTKVHQEFLRGTAAALSASNFKAQGEFTVVVGKSINASSINEIPIADAKVTAEFGQLTNVDGLTRRAAISALARKYGRSARDVYSAIERGKNCGL